MEILRVEQRCKIMPQPGAGQAACDIIIIKNYKDTLYRDVWWWGGSKEQVVFKLKTFVQGDAEQAHVLWRACAAVRCGHLLNQVLDAIYLGRC